MCMSSTYESCIKKVPVKCFSLFRFVCPILIFLLFFKTVLGTDEQYKHQLGSILHLIHCKNGFTKVEPSNVHTKWQSSSNNAKYNPTDSPMHCNFAQQFLSEFSF